MVITDGSNPKAPAIYGSIWSMWGVAAIIVALRFKARKIRDLSWEKDDWAVLVALFYNFATCISSSLGARYGVGKHIQDVSPHNQELWQKSLFYGNLVYVGTGPSVKIAALLLYNRVFAIPRFQRIAKFLCVVCLVWYIGETFGSIFNCVPVKGFWDKTVKARCISTLHFDIQYAVINISLDFIILALPVRVVLGLQLSKNQKLGLIGLFLMGGLATVMAIIRFVVFIINLKADYTFTWFQGVILSCIEPSVGVISVCLPVMRPVLLAALPRRLRDSFLNKSERLFSGNSQSKPTDNTIPSFKSTKNLRDDRAFYRLEGDEIPLEPVARTASMTMRGDEHGLTRTQISGSEAISAADGRANPLEEIVKRMDVDTFETPRSRG